MKKLLAIFLLPLITIAQDQQAYEIMKKADERFRGEARYAELSMEIIRPTWTREMKIKSWSLGTDFSMMLITAPARDEGTTFLMRDREVWNYLPRVDRQIKLPPSMMSQSWMGSDFSNNDLVNESSILTDYDHYMAGEETLEGRKCWKIRLVTKPDAPVVYDEVYVWIDQSTYNQLRIEYYGEDNELLDTMEFSDIRNMSGREIPSRMEIIPADEEGHKTVIRYEAIDFNPGITESFFTKQNMTKVR